MPAASRQERVDPSPALGLHVLICGFGSIGRRHARHLRALGAARVDAFSTGRGTPPPNGAAPPDQVFQNLDAALEAGPDLVVVANPTALHVPTARAAVEAGCHVLIEKPLSDRIDGCRELLAAARQRRRTVAVGCNMRFHPALGQVKEWIDAGEPFGSPLLARVHFGTYLPDWHPWEDYRWSYAARSELGGGAALTHVHEVDYAIWLLGEPVAVRALASSLKPLGTDVDEAAALLIRHASGALSAVTLSLAEQPPTRGLELALSDGSISVDLLSGRWTARAADGEVGEGGPPADFDIDDTYAAQARSLLAAISDGSEPEVSLESAIETLTTTLAVHDDHH